MLVLYQINALFPSDYLLGVFDKTRMDGLRFKVDDVFKDDDHVYAAPPWTAPRELEAVVYKLTEKFGISRSERKRMKKAFRILNSYVRVMTVFINFYRFFCTFIPRK